MKSIINEKNLKGRKILLRSTLDVSIKDGKIINDFRLIKARGTIDFLRKAEAKIILFGHIGKDGLESMSIVYEYFKKYLPIYFTGEIFGEKTISAIENMKNGDIVLLENLRKDNREILNDEDFSKELASLGEIYVNDAFSVSHREHSSIVGLPKYLPSFIGDLFEKEINELSDALNPSSPSFCILGGVKFNTKEPLIEKLINIYDKVFVSGALANDFFKIRGFNIGKSLSSDIGINLQKLIKNKKIIIPIDVIVQNKNGIFIKKPNEVEDEDSIKDSGPKTIEKIEELVKNSKFILWNGPLGEYENGFIKPTEELARILAKSSAKTIIGGGDTISAIEHLCIEKNFSFVSTGGGAMLKFLLDGTLVGIEALRLADN